MLFIPTLCEACARPALVRLITIQDGMTSCGSCGGTARVMPGETYAVLDVALFADLAEILKNANLTPAQAEQLAAELEPRSMLAPGRCLRRIVRALPSLGLLEPLVLHEANALRKAEGMLATLLQALASRRSHSGLVPSTPHSSPKASGDA